MSRVSFQTDTVVHVNILVPAYQFSVNPKEGTTRSDLAKKLDVDVEDVIVLPAGKKESSESKVHIALHTGFKLLDLLPKMTLTLILADTVGDLLRFKEENIELSETLERTSEALQG